MVQQNGLKQFSRLKYAHALNTSGLFLHKLMYKVLNFLNSGR